jgi:hypothetical protein
MKIVLVIAYIVCSLFSMVFGIYGWKSFSETILVGYPILKTIVIPFAFCLGTIVLPFYLSPPKEFLEALEKAEKKRQADRKEK